MCHRRALKVCLGGELIVRFVLFSLRVNMDFVTSGRSGESSSPSPRSVTHRLISPPFYPSHRLLQIRRAARELLKLDDKDPKRLFEGNALIRRLVRIGVLDDTRMRLDYVLALKTEDFLERRLQTQVFKLGWV